MFSYPSSIKIEITRAKLLYDITPLQIKIETDKKGLKIHTEPIKIEIDNRDFFSSLGYKTLDEIAQESVNLGKQAVVKAISKYTQQKNAMFGPNAMSIGEIKMKQMLKPIQSMMTYIPKDKPKISWSGGDVDIDYEKDDIEISWIPSKIEFQYIPYDIKYYTDEWKEVPDQINRKLMYLLSGGEESYVD